MTDNNQTMARDVSPSTVPAAVVAWLASYREAQNSERTCESCITDGRDDCPHRQLPWSHSQSLTTQLSTSPLALRTSSSTT